jgi:hypothetical protein
MWPWLQLQLPPDVFARLAWEAGRRRSTPEALVAALLTRACRTMPAQPHVCEVCSECGAPKNGPPA